MATALMFANISDLRRIAVNIYILIEVLAKTEANDLRKRYSHELHRFTEILKNVIKSLEGIKHVMLLDEPWDEMLSRIARDNYINVDDKDKIIKYIGNIIQYLEKLERGDGLDDYEASELKKFLKIVINVPIMYENRILRDLKA